MYDAFACVAWSRDSKCRRLGLLEWRFLAGALESWTIPRYRGGWGPAAAAAARDRAWRFGSAAAAAAASGPSRWGVSGVRAPVVVVVVGTALEEYAQIEGIQEAVAGTGGGEGAAAGPRRGHGEAASEA